MGLNCETSLPEIERIGVKVPMFSFHRLKGADIGLGVEMVSTGEVGCFGINKWEAFYKATVSSGYRFPKNNEGILVSIGSYGFKEEFLPTAKTLVDLGYQLYGTYGTKRIADY
jgi:hypothetical protein